MDAVKVIEPGPLTTIQDKGRHGYQRFGMPVAGAMDLFSYRAANLLAGNSDSAAAIEFTMLGPKIEFLRDAVIAVTGADILAMIDETPLSLWQSVNVSKGSIVSFKGIKSGVRGYIAIRGGLKVPEILGSKSTYLRAGVGGLAGRQLKADDIIAIDQPINRTDKQTQLQLPNSARPILKDHEQIRVILGPQEDSFTQDGVSTFLTSSYRITNKSDRMGYRLAGPKIQHKQDADIISDGIPPGAIQIPGDGQPIIMLADRQTTGGYTKIATVISADLSKLAQMPPGTTVNFTSVSINEARAATLKQEKAIESINTSYLKPSSERLFKIRISGQEFRVTLEEIIHNP